MTDQERQELVKEIVDQIMEMIEKANVVPEVKE